VSALRETFEPRTAGHVFCSIACRHRGQREPQELHDEVCAGTTSLHDAQHQFKSNWLKAYRREFG
jgi:hypothetical protein